MSQAEDNASLAAQRLHHLSMRYVAAFFEIAHGKTMGALHRNEPGIREMRDLTDLILLTRAEINALTRLLLQAKMVKPDQVQQAFAEEYEWFAQQKAKFLGVEVADYGLVFKQGLEPQDPPTPPPAAGTEQT